jgi:hypothetical protein
MLANLPPAIPDSFLSNLQLGLRERGIASMLGKEKRVCRTSAALKSQDLITFRFCKDVFFGTKRVWARQHKSRCTNGMMGMCDAG